MRNLLVATVTLVSLLLLIWWITARSPAARSSQPLTEASPGVDPAAAESRQRLLEIEAGADRGRALESTGSLGGEVASSTGATTDEARCDIFGTVADVSGRPLGDAHVRLQAWKVWAEGVDVPALAVHEHYRGWEQRTGADGRFRFVVPVPTVPRAWLTVHPDTYHDSAQIDFGGSSRERLPALTEGPRDLGTICLGPTGAIEGGVYGLEGQPVAGVELDAGPTCWTTYGRRGTSDASGRYSIPHAPPGVCSVGAYLAGYLSECTSNVQVDPGRTTTGIDFHLRPAPTLGGRVVDSSGKLLEGVRVEAWPDGSGRSASATSTAGGSFVLFVTKESPHRLEVDHPGHDPYRSADLGQSFEPGTRDIEIVLEPARMTRFRVLDGATMEPVERFGLAIFRDYGLSSSNRSFTSFDVLPAIGEHPGGEVVVGARPGIDRFLLVAPGYHDLEGEIEHDSAEDPTQTLRLHPGISVVGRLLLEGVPVPGCRVELARGRSAMADSGTMPLARERRPELERGLHDPRAPSAPPAEGSPGRIWRDDLTDIRTTSSDQEGRFRFDGIERGSYRLAAATTGGAMAQVVPVRVRSRARTDVGDVHLQPGASLHGRVLTPSGHSPASLQVILDPGAEVRVSLADDEGAFAFTGLAPGEHAVGVSPEPTRTVGLAAIPIELAGGESRSISLDLRGHWTCPVALRVSLNGRPAEGFSAYFVALDDSESTTEVGVTDAQGRIRGLVHALGPAELVLSSSDWVTFELPGRSFALEIGGSLDEVVELRSGSLALELPERLELPSDGVITAKLGRTGSEYLCLSTTLRLGSGNRPRHGVTLDPAARSLTFATLPVGRHDLSLEIIDLDAPENEVSLGDGWSTFEQVPMYEASIEVGVEETTRVGLP